MQYGSARAPGGRPNRTLADHLPESGFPSGVGVPSAVAAVLLVALAALCVVLLNVRAPGTVSDAVIESQQQQVKGAGQAIGASASQSVTDLRTATAVPIGDPNEFLAALAQDRKWRGVAILAGPTRTLVAARGEPVAVTVLPPTITDTAVTPAVGADGQFRMIAAVVLPQNRLLVASTAPRLPQPAPGNELRQALLLTTATGQVVESRGERPAAEDAEINRLVTLASAAAADGQSGSLLGAAGTEQATVAYAPVTASGLTGSLGLATLSVAYSPVVAGAAGGQGIDPAIALAGIALLGLLLVRVVLVNPVRRLRRDALSVAGGRLAQRVRRYSTPELRRIAAGLEHCRSTVAAVPPNRPRPSRGLSAQLAVALGGAAVLAWSAGAFLTVGNRDVSVPPSVVGSVRSQTAGAAEAVRRSVNDGLADLKAVAALGAGKAPAALGPALDELIARQSRYRSVYVVDQNGQVLVQFGKAPLAPVDRPPAEAGVRQQNDSGRVPVLIAHAPLPAGGSAVVGEFDHDHLAGLLGRAPGRVRLVNSGLRTIAATDGYVAFEELGGDGPRNSAREAQRGEPVADVQDVPGDRAVVVAAPVRGGATGKLGWTVVAQQPVGELALADNVLRRNAMVVALAGVLIAMLMVGWQHLVLIRPLRRLAAAADGLVAGDRQTVIYPQHHDQIGTIASCLEICRQALTDGIGRLGEVRRPRGAATDVTELIRRVPPAGPTGRFSRTRRAHRGALLK